MQIADDALLQTLEFRREVMAQVPIVSTMLAVLAMGLAATLLTWGEKGRLRNALIATLTASSLLFVFATAVDATILPAMKHASTHRPGQIEGLLNLARVVVITTGLAVLALFGSIGAFGYLVSRRVGAWVLGASVAITAMFAVCCFYLDRVVRR